MKLLPRITSKENWFCSLLADSRIFYNVSDKNIKSKSLKYEANFLHMERKKQKNFKTLMSPLFLPSLMLLQTHSFQFLKAIRPGFPGVPLNPLFPRSPFCPGGPWAPRSPLALSFPLTPGFPLGPGGP